MSDDTWRQGALVAMSPIYLTNFASLRSTGYRGEGRVLTIMAAPRAWEHGDGRVRALIPSSVDLRGLHDGSLSPDEYRRRFVERLTAWGRIGQLAPEALWTSADDGSPVRGGDTLCCACSREAARAGRCHRSWSAVALRAAGWDVVLDGVGP